MTKALVVDDSRAVRMILGKTLKELGLRSPRGGQRAGGAGSDRSRRTIASTLVLADWNMPEMNGLELLKRLRQKPELASLVVVMVTTETEIGPDGGGPGSRAPTNM